MTVENVELGLLDWTAKITERVTFILLNIKDKREITEDDYAILKVLHKVWYNGEHPLYKTIMDGDCHSVTQTNWITDVSTVSNTSPEEGTIVDYTISEPKTDSDDKEE